MSDAGAALTSASRFDKAEELYALLLKRQPSNRLAYCGLLLSAYCQADWPRIVSLYDQQPPNFEADLESAQAFAYAFELTGKFDEGLAEYTSSLDTDHAALWALLGASRCRAGMNDYPEAFRFAELALAVDNSLDTHEQRASIHLAAGTCTELRDDYAVKLSLIHI